MMSRPIATVLLVLVLSLAAGARAGPADPLFDAPVRADSPAPPADLPLPPSPRSDQHPGYDLVFRFLDPAPRAAPELTVLEGQRASVSVISQVSFVEDFDVEVAQSAFIADPVIGVVSEGLTLDVRALPTPDRRGVVLAYAVDLSELDGALRTREFRVAGFGDPVTIQLPALVRSRFVGRARLAPGVETVLLRTPSASGRETTVTVTATPILLRNPGRQGLPEVLGIPRGEAEPEPLLDDADRLAPPAAGPLEIRLVRMAAPAELRPIHLTLAAADAVLPAMRVQTLRRLEFRAAPEPGATVLLAREESYLAEYREMTTGREVVVDPQVGVARTGLEGRFLVRDGEAVFAFTLSSRRGLGERERDGAGSVEVPLLRRTEGELRLRADVNLLPIAILEDGETLGLLIRR